MVFQSEGFCLRFLLAYGQPLPFHMFSLREFAQCSMHGVEREMGQSKTLCGGEVGWKQSGDSVVEHLLLFQEI